METFKDILFETSPLLTLELDKLDWLVWLLMVGLLIVELFDEALVANLVIYFEFNKFLHFPTIQLVWFYK